MNKIFYEVLPNQKFKNFIVRPICTERVSDSKDVIVGNIPHVEDYYDVEYPVRTNYLKENDLTKVYYEKNGYSEVYIPFERDRIDYSSGASVPRKVFTYTKTFFEIQNAGDYKFQLKTCGAVIIWVNQEKSFTFAPYTRNQGTKTELTLHLSKGTNEIVIYFEDLAERDVSFYFEFVNQNHWCRIN